MNQEISKLLTEPPKIRVSGSFLARGINNPSNEPNVSQVWIYFPSPLLLTDTLETIDQLTALGWVEAPPLYQVPLHTQLHKTAYVQSLSTGQNALWTHKDSKQYVEKYPVALVSEIDFPKEIVDQFKVIAGTPSLEMLNPLPLSSSGMGAFLFKYDDPDSELIGYRIQDLSLAAKKRWGQIKKVLEGIAGPDKWIIFRQLHRIAADPVAFQRELNQLTAREQVTRGAMREEVRRNIRQLHMARDEVREIIRIQDEPTYPEKVEEARQLMQALARDYYEHYLQAEAMQKGQLFPLESVEKKKVQSRPVMQPTFNTQGYAPIVAAQPMQAILNSIHNATSGAYAWVFDEANSNYSQAPYFIHERKTGSTIVEYKQQEASVLPDSRAARMLWNEVKTFDDQATDILLDIFSHLSRNMQDGAAWFFASDHLDHRGMIPVTKADGPGKRRRAGHRKEDVQQISQTLSRLENLWVTIRQYIDEDAPQKGKKKRKKTLYTHTGRVLMVSEKWYQNELTGDEGTNLPPSSGTVIGWYIRPGDWLRTFLEAPNYQVTQLCQVLMHYDPYREKWEKRIGYYLMFHGHMQCKGKAGVLTRSITNILDEVSLPLDEDHPIRTRKHFEEAMDKLRDDSVIDGWSYSEDIEMPKKNWLALWLDRKIDIYIAPPNLSLKPAQK